MSHQSRRRRTYGRRQHELTERRERRARNERLDEVAADERSPIVSSDFQTPGGGFDLLPARLSWLEGG